MYSVKREKNFIFIHILKTGGASIKNHLLRYIDNDLLAYAPRQQGLGCSGRKYHPTSSDLKSFLGDEEYALRYKFTVVRNPWDRMVSLYHWGLGSSSPEILATYEESVASGKIVETLKDKTLPLIQRKYTIQYTTFPQFIQSLADPETRAPLSRKALDDFFNADEMDTIVRYEDLQSGFDKVCEDLGIQKDILSHIHVSEHEHYSTYYDDELRDIVRKVCAADIEQFGYEFEKKK